MYLQSILAIRRRGACLACEAVVSKA